MVARRFRGPMANFAAQSVNFAKREWWKPAFVKKCPLKRNVLWRHDLGSGLTLGKRLST